MEKTTMIDGKQFFAIAFLYIMCNDLIRGRYVGEIKQDIWVANLLGLLGGVLLYLIYFLIYKKSGCSSFTEAIEHILGKFLAKVVFAIYIIYSLVLITTVIANVISKIDIYLLEGIPFYLLGFILLLTASYIVIKGVETLGRTCFIVFITTSLTLILLLFTSVLTNKVDFGYIKPILAEGFGKVIAPSLKMSYAVPFGESFSLLIIFQHVNNKTKNYKYGAFGLILAGIFMNISSFLCLFVLGQHGFLHFVNPSLQLASQIKYKNFIQRLDIIVMCILVIFVIIRFAILLFNSLTLLKTFIKFPSSKDFIPLLIICIIIAIASEFIVNNFNEFSYFNRCFINDNIKLILEVGIPFLIILISFFRKKKNPQKQLNVAIPQIIN